MLVCGVFGKRHELSFGSLVEYYVLDFGEKLVVAYSRIFDERLYVVPETFILFAIGVEQRIQLVADFLYNVRAYFCDVSV